MMAETAVGSSIIQKIRNNEPEGIRDLLKTFSTNVGNFLRCFFQDRWVLEREEEWFWQTIIPKIHDNRDAIDLNVFIYKELLAQTKEIVDVWDYNGPVEICLPDEGEYLGELHDQLTVVFGKKIILNSETVDKLKKIMNDLEFDDLESLGWEITIFGKLLKLPEDDILKILGINREKMAGQVLGSYISMSKTLINMGLIEKEDVFDPSEAQRADILKNMAESPEPIFSNSRLLGNRAIRIVSDLLETHHPVTASQSVREKILRWVQYDYFVPESEKTEAPLSKSVENGSGCINAVLLLILAIIASFGG
jgi:hypothetical protein